MKKMLSLLLCVISFLNLLVVGAMPTYAETPVNLDDHLVVHYDFKGATVAEALTDKATAGDVDDDLVVYSKTNPTDTTETTGTVREVGSDEFKEVFALDPVKGTATNLRTSANMRAATSVDIQKLYNSGENKGATWFFRFKVEDVSASTETRILDMRFNAKSGKTMTSFLANNMGNLYTVAARTNSATNTYWYSQNGPITSGVYINFAVVMEHLTVVVDQATGTTQRQVKYIPYYSIGNSTEWHELTGQQGAFRTDALTSNPLCLFDRHDCAGANTTGLTYDDVRLYDTILTKDQIATIIPTDLQNDAFAFDTGDFGFDMMEGAKVRLNEVTGIRFESNLDVATYESLISTYGAENVKYGTLIAPKSYYEEAGAMTFEALEKLDKAVKYLKVEAGAFYKTGNTVNTIAGSIAKIDERNYTANYTAVGYIEITVGEDIFYLYADVPQTRSIAQVAETAVNDRRTTEGVEGYGNKIEDGNVNGEYSPYDKDQIDLLKTFY